MTTEALRRSAIVALTVLGAFGIGVQRAAAQQAVDFQGWTCAHAVSAPLAARALRDYARLGSLSEDADRRLRHVVRRSDAVVADPCAGNAASTWAGLGVRALPVVLGGWHNSGYAEDRDNGLVWAGRGWSGSATAGAALSYGPITAAWVPELAFQQNEEFEIVPRALPGFSEYLNAHYYTIDLPQRMGAEGFTTADAAGQSFVRADAYGATVGWSHENVVVGPGIRNQILMSATAGGFHHFFAGTGAPADLRWLDLEVQAIVGRATESDLFDARPDNDRSDLLLWTLAVRPHGLDGLELGAARVLMYTAAPDDGWSDGALELFDMVLPGGGSPAGNRMTSLWARWVLPRSGTEVYAEWARSDDFSRFANEFVTEPDHSQAYTLGFQRITPLLGGGLRLQAELTALQEKAEPREGRPLPIYYTHERHVQGYTHEGQLLGAGIGPGADAQFIGVDYFRSWGHAGLFVERVRRNDLSPLAVRTRFYNYEHDTAVTYGARGMVFLPGEVALALTVSRSRRYNRDFIADDANTQLVTELSWTPPLP